MLSKKFRSVITQLTFKSYGVLVAIMLTESFAQARQITDAANSYRTTATSVAALAGAAGLATGGTMQAIPGLGHAGKKVIIGSIVALVCGVGGETALQTIQSIFQ